MTEKKKKKKNGSSRPYTKEEVKQFIDNAMGSIAKASSDLGVPYSTFYSWMEAYELKAYPDEIKRRVALMALDRAKYLAFTPAKILKANGEKPSVTLLQDILNKWGKYIQFEEPAAKTEVHHTSGNPWEIVLSEIDPQRKKKDDDSETGTDKSMQK